MRLSHCRPRDHRFKSDTIAYWRNHMRKRSIKLIASAFLLQVVFPCSNGRAQVRAEKVRYPAMAPLDQYLMPSESAEIALARSAAPAAISDGAEVMALRRDGYAT